jgi:hypothetical protein
MRCCRPHSRLTRSPTILVLPNRLTTFFGVALVVAGASACAEDFQGGAGCPVLCPESGFEIVSDTLDAVIALDTAIRGYPLPGDENSLTLLQRFGNGDTVITAGIVRFDFIAKTIPVGTNDSTPIVKLDSVILRLNAAPLDGDTLSARDTLKRVPVTIEVYDVDTAASDFDTAAVRARFRPETLIGSYTARRDSLTDSVVVALDTAAVRARVQTGRLRIGLRIRSDSSMQVPIRAAVAGGPLFVRYRATGASGDTVTRTITPASASSGTEGDVPILDDYLIVLRGTPPPPPQILAIGGLPAHRVYMRFAIPPQLVDSVTVVRASLVLTQTPVRGRTDDTVRAAVQANVSVATPVVEPGRAALLVRSLPGLEERARAPQDSGVVRFELAGTIPFWRFTPEDELPRALVFRSSREGHFPSELHFFSSEAPANLRPRLEISYVPRVDFSLP